jgi:tRNA A-37 threonylcarbamoyl transferase component Bud32
LAFRAAAFILYKDREGAMKTIKNDAACFHYYDDEALKVSLERVCRLVSGHPSVLEPVQDMSEHLKETLASEGFMLYGTVKKTTLFYDPKTDCFFKILHPLHLKEKVLFRFINRAAAIYSLMEYLYARGVRVQRVNAYGMFKTGRRPFFVVRKAEGESLYDLLIRQQKRLAMAEYEKVMDVTAKLHALGYWFGDAHLSHIFITEKGVSGIIDIDSIRRNRPFKVKNPAKDLAGLNHPELPLSEDEKRSLMTYYVRLTGTHNEKKFLQLIKYYTERRWA